MSKKINGGIVRWVKVENNDYETFAKECLEHFGCTDMAPYNTYLAKLVNDGEKVSEYKFMIVGNSLFQVGHIKDYTETGFFGMFPSDRNNEFQFISALDEDTDLEKTLELYLTEMFKHINQFINKSDIVEKWIEACPEDAKNAINKLNELIDGK